MITYQLGQFTLELFMKELDDIEIIIAELLIPATILKISFVFFDFTLHLREFNFDFRDSGLENLGGRPGL